MEQLLSDLHFAYSYYMLREYLYYAYNAPDTLQWYRDDDGDITIKINDPTLIRQYYLKASNGFVGSMETFQDNDTEKILALVKGTEEFSPNPVGDELAALIMKEVDRKLSVYFNYLDGAPDVQLGPYTFGTYKAVLRVLVFKALYHRYHSRANGKFGIVQDSEDGLISMITANGAATAPEAKAILPTSRMDEIRPSGCSRCTTPSSGCRARKRSSSVRSTSQRGKGTSTSSASSHSRTPTCSCATSATPSGNNSPKQSPQNSETRDSSPRRTSPSALRPNAAGHRPARHFRRAHSRLCRPRVRNQEPGTGTIEGLPACAE